MDGIFNTMHLGPQTTAPIEDVRTLSERLSWAEQVIRQQEREIRILAELHKKGKSPEETQKGEDIFRRKKRQLLLAQMYGGEGQFFQDYRDLGAGANCDQQPADVGPEEFINFEEVLLDDGPGPLVQPDHFSASHHAIKTDMKASNKCEGCGKERICKGAANFDDKTCPMCVQLGGDHLDLGGIGIPGRGEHHMHQMHEYSSDPLQVNSTSSMGGSKRNSPEQCAFCHGVLPPGSGPSHLSSCPEYQRWSMDGSNDSFFYQSRRSLKKDRDSMSSSPLLIDATFPAD